MSDYDTWSFSDLVDEIKRLQSKVEAESFTTMEARRNCPDCKVTRVFDSAKIHLEKNNSAREIAIGETFSSGNLFIQNHMMNDAIFLTVGEYKREVQE